MGNPKQAIPVIEYIVREMRVNAASHDVARMRELNTFTAADCIREWQQQSLLQQIFGPPPGDCVDRETSFRLAALGIWAANVRQNGPWDHKPKIRTRFRGVYHQLGPQYEYYYDIWSNIHYGYVGTAAAFRESQLLDGAGLEQVGSDVLRGRAPTHRPGEGWMRGFDDPSDQASISIGISLWGTRPVTVDAIQRRVLASHDLSRRPVSEQAH